jgi:cobalt transporter subunit CbtB
MLMNSEAMKLQARSVTGAADVRAQARRVALVAGLLGVALVYTVGFASPQFIHDAAHDSRHALSFPCH